MTYATAVAAQMLLNAIAWQLEETRGEGRPRVRVLADQEPDETGREPERIAELADRLHAGTSAVRDRVSEEPRWLQPAYAMSMFGEPPSELWRRRLDAIDRLATQAQRLSAYVDRRVLAFRPPAEFDGGFKGVVALLEESIDFLSMALEHWDLEVGDPSPNPYYLWDRSPYHLVAGAAAEVNAAAILCSAFNHVPTA